MSFALAVAGLSLATWIYAGYRYAVWPETATLDYVFRYDGQLKNDWHTSLPSVHWFVTHALGVLPVSAVKPAVFVLWVLYLVILWAGFLLICEGLGAPIYIGFAAGLALLPTALSGVGTSDALLSYFYPVGLSFALAVLGFGFLVQRRLYSGFAALGVATLVHPNVGVLMGACIAPLVLVLGERSWRRLIGPFLLGSALALPALIETALYQTGGGHLTAKQSFDLMALVREPHHVLFSAFTTAEYARTGLWLLIAVVAFAVLWRVVEARAVALVVLIVLLLAAAGAYASGHGSPLLLVQAHMARVTPLIVLSGAALMAGVAARVGRWWAAAAIVGGAFVAQVAVREFFKNPGSWFSPGIVAGALLVLAVAAAAVIGRAGLRHRVIRYGAVAFGAAVLVLGVYMAHTKSLRVPPTSPDLAAYKQIAADAEHVSKPGALVMTPLDQDGFRTYSHRAVIVEFGTFRYGDGDTEWIRRVNALTQDPRVLDPSFAHSVYKRVPVVAADYDHVAATSKLPICTYRPQLAVLRANVHAPPWLKPVSHNGYYALYRVDAARYC